MRILNIGSLNFDRVYGVDHFVQPGETILNHSYGEFLGGKGLNQSVALGKAGAIVYHAGAIGADGEPFLTALQEAGVNSSLLMRLPTVSGHAIIQSSKGQNCIIVCGGANQCLTEEYIDHCLSNFGEGDLLLLQNEVNLIPYAMKKAKARGMRIAFNASPITEELLEYPLELVDYFLVNEIEAAALAGYGAEGFPNILEALYMRYPQAAIVMTVGKDGVLFRDKSRNLTQKGVRVEAVDTTAAGDTFTGFFLGALARGETVQEALRQGTFAAALSVTKKGAVPSIPELDTVLDFGK